MSKTKAFGINDFLILSLLLRLMEPLPYSSPLNLFWTSFIASGSLLPHNIIFSRHCWAVVNKLGPCVESAATLLRLPTNFFSQWTVSMSGWNCRGWGVNSTADTSKREYCSGYLRLKRLNSCYPDFNLVSSQSTCSFCVTSDIEFEFFISPTCLLLIVRGKDVHNRSSTVLK